MLQGRYLTTTLHSLSVCVMGLCGGELNSYERGQLNARHARNLKTMWEANCSCRRAGYPEGGIVELNQTWGDGSTCSGLPSPMDVPTRSQAAARESAADMLRSLRQLAGRVQLDQPAAAGDGDSISDPFSYAAWEVLQAELLASAPSSTQPEGSPSSAQPEGAPTSAQPEGSPSSTPSERPPSSCSWGEALWCFNPACINLEGPGELALRTFACGGGCGVRYCSPECQAQGWRDGHKLSCGRLGRPLTLTVY